MGVRLPESSMRGHRRESEGFHPLTHSPTHALSISVLALKWGTDEGRELLKAREAKNPVRNSLFQECLPWVRGLGSVFPLMSKVSMTLGSQCIYSGYLQNMSWWL